MSIVLETTDLHIADCTEEIFKLSPPSHPFPASPRRKFLTGYLKGSSNYLSVVWVLGMWRTDSSHPGGMAWLAAELVLMHY